MPARFLCNGHCDRKRSHHEIGYLPVTPGGGNLFFQLVNARYQKGAMIITSNSGFAEWDPNGHRLELACNIGRPEQYAELKDLAPVMLEEWSRTKRAPRHAAWLHEEPADRRRG